MAARKVADFWFDPACPYTWLTTRWLLAAAKVRPIEVRWNVMSLSVLNEGRDDDPEGDPEGYLWVPVRICAAVRQKYGQAALGRFYIALWTHARQESQDWIGDVGDALEHADLPRELAEVGMLPDYDDAVRASHAEGISRIGTHVGTPIIAVGGDERTAVGGDERTAVGGDERTAAFFGPIISEVPTGERAGELWDATLLVAGTPGFHELKGAPPAPPKFD